MTDFRTERMPSPEGAEVARSRWVKAWNAYEKQALKVMKPVRPITDPLLKPLASSMTVDLVGFWTCWHLLGGYEGMRKVGMSRSAIYRKLALFRRTFGEHPDTYRFPGIAIDVEGFIAAAEASGD